MSVVCDKCGRPIDDDDDAHSEVWACGDELWWHVECCPVCTDEAP